MKIVIPVERLGKTEAEGAQVVRKLDKGFHQYSSVATGEREDQRVDECVELPIAGETMFIRQSTAGLVGELCHLADVILVAHPELSEEDVRSWRQFLANRTAVVADGGRDFYVNGRKGVSREDFDAMIKANQWDIPPVLDTMRKDEVWEKYAEGENPKERGPDLEERAAIYAPGGGEPKTLAELSQDPEADVDSVLREVIDNIKRAA